MGTSPTDTALAVVEMARNGRFADIEELFAPPLRLLVSAQALRDAWTAEVGQASAVGEPVAEEGGSVSVPVSGEHGERVVVMAVDETGLVQGMRIASAETVPWSQPPYADPEVFTEQEVTVGSGELAVPGTLTLPRAGGARAGVVLLSGGGPFDRDGTAGVNKPLKDLAWGLASRGVAVLRFDKVTHVHGQAVTTPGFTMADEYVPHAVAAVHLLQGYADRVHVLGHSMGGKVAPRVAAAEPAVAGMVVLAGDTVPMHHAVVRVVRYLASLNPTPSAEAAVDALIEQVALVDSPDLSASTPAEELPFGMSGAYWLDLRDYDPVATAAALDKPMFILQGGRDYQVTVEDDLARWRELLANRSDVTIRVYDADNHMFFPGEGPSTPAEYEAPQHVDPAVVADVADWLTAR